MSCTSVRIHIISRDFISFESVMQALMKITRYEKTFNTLHARISSFKDSFRSRFAFSAPSVFNVYFNARQHEKQRSFQVRTDRQFLQNVPYNSGIFLPSEFIIRCRATHRDECLLPVIYRSLSPQSRISVHLPPFPPFGMCLLLPSPSAASLDAHS